MGLKNVEKVIAVNKDKKAPVMQKADLGIVADVHEFVPLLIDKLKD